MKKLKIVFIEPFYKDSHKHWLDQFKNFSFHEIDLLTLPGRHWKWRMHGGAITLARKVNELDYLPDLLLCSDMLHLALFKSLLSKRFIHIPIGIYFHENQISYPWSPDDADVELKRDRHYGFINYTSALVADKIFFNSDYHMGSFIGALTSFLNAFPDYQNLETIENIKSKSKVLYLGLDLKSLDPYKTKPKKAIPCILWNHRWEYDKNPEQFFETILRLKEEKIFFKLIVTGKSYNKIPDIFARAQTLLKDEIIYWGYASSKDEYYALLNEATIYPVTSMQDFFGISVVEAIYMGAIPLLPKRLAYSEHVTQEEFFYRDSEEFYQKLCLLTLNQWSIPDLDLKNIKRYDWSEMIIAYDRAMNEMI